MRKVNLNNLMIFIISICIIADLQCFYVVNLDAMIFKILEFITAMLAFGIYVFKHKGKVEEGIFYYKLYIIVYIFLIQLLYSLGYKNYSLYEFLAESYRYSAVFLILPVFEVLSNNSLRKKFEKIVKWIAFSQIIVSFIAIYNLMKYGVNITTKNFSYRAIGRFDMSISMGNTLIILMAIVASFEWISSFELQLDQKVRVRDIFLVILSFLYMIIVIKSRTLIISLTVAIAAMIILKKKLTSRVLILKMAVIFIFFLGLNILSSSGVLDEIFNITSGTFSSSNSAHLIAMAECIEYFKEHWLLGAGINLDWPVSYCDSGFSGLLANLGLLGAGIFLKPLIDQIKGYYSSKNSVYNSLIVGLITFTALTSVTLILTDEQRMLTWMLMYSIVYWLSNLNLKNSDRYEGDCH